MNHVLCASDAPDCSEIRKSAHTALAVFQACKTESLPEEAAPPDTLSLHFNTCHASSEVAGRCTEAAESSAAAAPAPTAEVLSLRSANRPIEREAFSFISEITAKWFQFGNVHM